MLVPSSAYDRRVPAGMLLPSGLTCARIVLYDDPDPNPGAGIVLLSYRSSHLTALHPTRPRAVTPAKRTLPTSLVPIRLRSDKPRTDMPCEPNTTRSSQIGRAHV